MARIWKNYGLGIALMGLFLVAWALMSWTGWVRFVAQQQEHHESAHWFGLSGYIWQWGVQTFSNWQSDLLGEAIAVVLGAYLIFRGSQESKDTEDHIDEMVQRIERRLDSRDGADATLSSGQAQKGRGGVMRGYGLAIVLFAAFALSWIAQTWMGWMYFVSQQHEHHQAASVFGSSGYVWDWAVTTLQNWQSDIMGQGAIVILSAYLIYKNSAQSRDTGDRIEQVVQRIEQRVEQMDGALVAGAEQGRRAPRATASR